MVEIQCFDVLPLFKTNWKQIPPGIFWYTMQRHFKVSLKCLNPCWFYFLSLILLSVWWIDLLPSVPLEHFYHMVEADRVGALFSSHTCRCCCWLVQRCRCRRCVNRGTRLWFGPNSSSSRLREDPCKLSVLQSQSTMSSHSTHSNI